MGILHPDHSGASSNKKIANLVPRRRRAAIERLEQRQLLSAAIVTSAAHATATHQLQLYAVDQTVNANSSAPTRTTSAIGAISPTVTSISPAIGSPAGGTVVTIKGTNLGTVVGVLFGNVVASNFKINSPTSITATAPAQPAGVVDVQVVLASAALSATSAADHFTYTAVVGPTPPTVATPASAMPSPVTGTTTALSVLGADAAGEPSLTYAWATTGSPPAPVVFSANNSNAAKNTVATFSKAGVYNFQVTITDPSSLTVTSMVMVPVNATLTSITVSPAACQLAVGGVQQFTATALDQFGVALAVQPAFTWMGNANGTVSNTGLFTATTLGAPMNVTATSGATSGTATVAVLPVTAQPPGVASLVPTNGPLAGGTTVTVTGSNFIGTTAVMFGGANATSFVVVNAVTIRAVSPAGAAGAVDVTVVTAAGTSAVNAGDKFTFNGVMAPTVTVVNPATGPLLGGNTVTITGTNFTGATEVDFGANMDFNFAVISATDITVQAPSEPAGVVDVKVITPAGTSAISAADRYTFAIAGPTVATPASAMPNPVTGTTTALSVLGADAAGQPSLTYTWATTGVPPAPVLFSINGNNAASNTTATFSQAGVYNFQVTITDPSFLTVTSAVMVTVNVTLTSITVAPANAPVMIAGTQQFSATALDQFGVPLALQPAIVWTVAGGGTIDNTGLFTATTAGGPFVVTATSGIVKGTASVTVPPPPPPAVTGVSPALGSLAGGELVTITGSNFTGAATVAFGAVNATNVTVISATLITASAPAEANGAVDVTVTTPAGTSTKTPADLFTFDDAPTVAATANFTPNASNASGVLSVLGADDGGEANLTYSWATTGIPAAPVVFSDNGDNAAKSTTVTFTRPGVYDFQVTITDGSGLTTISAVSATITSTLTTIEMTPPIATVGLDQTQQFSATGLDQFGGVLAAQPTFTWAATAGGTISAAGLFLASAVGGPFTVTATSGSVSGTADATVVGPTFLGQITSTRKPQEFSADLADGAELTVKLHFGSVIISQFNNEVYLVVTGTTGRSTLVVGGSITFASVSVSGPLQMFQALNGNLAGDMSVDGSVTTLQIRTITGTFAAAGSIGVAKIGDVSGTLASTGAMKRVTIGAVNGALILSGANLGPDGLFGGGDDTFGAGSIGFLSIESPVVDSQIEAGVNPGPDGVFGSADDFLSGGGSIGKIALSGIPDSISRFEAGQFGVVSMPPRDFDTVPTRLKEPLLDPNFVIPKS